MYAVVDLNLRELEVKNNHFGAPKLSRILNSLAWLNRYSLNQQKINISV